MDPPLAIKRGPHILAAQEDPNHAGTEPNTGFSTIGTGTRTSKWVARGVQSALTLKAIRKDDATHDATTGRSAIDRVITGADPKLAPATDSQPKALPLHPTARHPACTAQAHSPTSTPSMRLNLPSDTRVWRELIEETCSGHNVRRPLDNQPGGFAWLGQTMGGGHITFRCQNCPACGQRADARHILTNECNHFRIPENVRNMLRQLLCDKIGKETLMLDAINTPEAHNMAQAIEKTANTLFGDTPPPRTVEGWKKYTRAIRLLAGGLPDSSSK